MTKHTQGPWRVAATEYSPLDIVGADGDGVAECALRDRDGESLANARLISAAPDLLTSLDNLRDCLEEPDQFSNMQEYHATLSGLLTEAELATSRARGGNHE